MKKYIIAFLLIASQCISGPIVRFEIGPATEDKIYFTDIMVGYRFSIFNITSMTYGGIRTWSYFDNNKGYPFEDIYTLEQKISYGGVFIRAKHHCSHPVVSQYSARPDTQYWLGDITTVSVGYEIELK